MTDGVIADFHVTEKMLQYLLQSTREQLFENQSPRGGGGGGGGGGAGGGGVGVGGGDRGVEASAGVGGGGGWAGVLVSDCSL